MRAGIVIAALAVASCADHAAQDLPLEPGRRLRVSAPECGVRKQVTTSEAFRGDTLIPDATACPLASVTRLDVHRGRHGHPWRGAVLGILGVTSSGRQ